MRVSGTGCIMNVSAQLAHDHNAICNTLSATMTNRCALSLCGSRPTKVIKMNEIHLSQIKADLSITYLHTHIPAAMVASC